MQARKTRLRSSCEGGSDHTATVTHRASKGGVAPAQSGVFFCVTFLISCRSFPRFPETYAHPKLKKMLKAKLK